MRQGTDEERLLMGVRRLRLVLQCRDTREVRLCEHLAFAYARDAGLRGLDVFYVGACASVLAEHAVSSGGGALTLSVVSAARDALELQLMHDTLLSAATPRELHVARSYVDELDVARGDDGGSVIVARKWLRGNS